MKKMKQRRTFGQSLVEFALVTPLFLTLIFGVIEGGRMIHAYNAVNHSAQEAARLGVIADTASVGAVQAKAVDAASPLSVSSGDVSVEVNDGGTSFSDRDIGDKLTVTVSHEFTPIVSLMFGAGASFSLSATSQLMVE